MEVAKWKPCISKKPYSVLLHLIATKKDEGGADCSPPRHVEKTKNLGFTRCTFLPLNRGEHKKEDGNESPRSQSQQKRRAVERGGKSSLFGLSGPKQIGREKESQFKAVEP